MKPPPEPLANNLDFLFLFFSEFGPYFLVVVVLILCSAITSGAEIAFFSLTKSMADQLKKENGSIREILKYPHKLLATILIFNNLVNVGIVIITTFAFRKMTTIYGWTGIMSDYIIPFIQIVVVTFILLFFGEISPKIYANTNRVAFVKRITRFFLVIRWFFSPLSAIMVKFTKIVEQRLRVKKEYASYEDLKQAIDLTSDEESPDEEKEILKGIINFSNTSVKSIMTSRVDVKALDADADFDDVTKFINEYTFSRIPVYSENLDNMGGILYIKDLLKVLKEKESQSTWNTKVRKPYFVPETKKIDDLLDEFKTKRLHIAIVVDEFGGTAGIVTLEDIIEEIFGEINDEFDEDELIYSKLSEREYVFEGKFPLTDLVKIVNIKENVFDEVKEDSDSLAGLILQIHGKIPKKGDIIRYERFEFLIESVGTSRIKRVKITINEHSPS